VALTTSVLDDDGVALLVLEGELDLSTCGKVDLAVDRMLADGMRLVVVDLTPLRFCDSTGLAALLRASKRVRAEGGSCLVAGPRGAVRRILSMTRLERALTVVDDVQPALVALRRQLERGRGDEVDR
jgi:anti-sigma B factor antagonist